MRVAGKRQVHSQLTKHADVVWCVCETQGEHRSGQGWDRRRYPGSLQTYQSNVDFRQSTARVREQRQPSLLQQILEQRFSGVLEIVIATNAKRAMPAGEIGQRRHQIRKEGDVLPKIAQHEDEVEMLFAEFCQGILNQLELPLAIAVEIGDDRQMKLSGRAYALQRLFPKNDSFSQKARRAVGVLRLVGADTLSTGKDKMGKACCAQHTADEEKGPGQWQRRLDDEEADRAGQHQARSNKEDDPDCRPQERSPVRPEESATQVE